MRSGEPNHGALVRHLTEPSRAMQVELQGDESARLTAGRAAGRKDRWEFAVFRFVFGLFAALPRERALQAGAALGSLFYVADRPHRRVALRNLQIAFPERTDAERCALLRRSCRNLGRLAAEFCHLEELTAESVRDYVTIANPEAWQRALDSARERGAVILTGHFGSWELLAYAQSLLGQPITLVHRPMRNRLVDAAVDRVRARAGTRAIAKKAAAREALRALRRHEIVVVPADQNQTHSYGVFVDLFGVPACTTPGPARLAMLTGAPVYPVFLVREGETARHRIVLLPEVEMVRTGNRDADIIANTQRCTAVIERMLREHPDHWIWFHKRWKTRPPGAPKLY